MMKTATTRTQARPMIVCLTLGCRFSYSLRISVLGWVICILASTASAQDRTALVVANYDYGEHQLSGVKADAAAVGEALRREGFRVTVAENVPGKELKNTVEQFARSTVTRGVAVLYFAGFAGQYPTSQSRGAPWSHIQGAGKPADANRLDRESLAVAEVVKLLVEHSAASENLLILDACRPNPFLAEKKNQPAGLAAMEGSELPDETLVLFAAQPDSSVGEAEERSPLAAALTKHLPQGRQSVGKMLEAVCKEVEQQSGGKQRPWFVAGSERLAAVSLPPYENRSFLDSQQPREGDRPGQEWINGHGMVFCWCPPGTFTMGSSQADRAGLEDAEQAEVTLSKGFWIGKYEVTLQEGRRAGWTPYLKLTDHKNAPMHNLAQGQTSKVINKLNETERKAGRLPAGWEYALPTEAQWEYACRAGTNTRFFFGDDESQLHFHANYADRSLLADDGAMQWADGRFDDGTGKSLARVGSYRPNAWGLHDVHGNVAEWCEDRYLAHLPGGTDPLIDAKVKEATSDGVIRGGAWCSTSTYCESGFRNSEFAAKDRDFIGFRIVLRRK